MLPTPAVVAVTVVAGTVDDATEAVTRAIDAVTVVNCDKRTKTQHKYVITKLFLSMKI